MRLDRTDVLAYLDRLAPALERSRATWTRTEALADLIGPSQRIPLRAALDAVTGSRNDRNRLASFRMYRKDLREVTAAAGLQPHEFALSVDDLRTPPETRTCWFEGISVTGVLARGAAVEMSDAAARLVREGPADPGVGFVSRTSGESMLAPAVRETLIGPGGADEIGEFVAYQAAAPLDAGVQLIDPQASVGRLRREATGARTQDAARVPAIPRLMSWLTLEGEPAHCALLGDFGMGKTTACRMLTKELIERRRTGDETVPVPLLFDLTDTAVDERGRAPANLPTLLTGLLDRSPAPKKPTPEEVLEVIARGNCVVILDGLDEALVKMSHVEGLRFVRMLWASVDLLAEGPAGDAPRVLMACRTHYYRDIEHEAAHYTAEDRDGPRRRAFLVLELLEFTPRQISEYLEKNLRASAGDAFLDMVDSVYDLRALTSRPVILRWLTEDAGLLSGLDRAAPADMYERIIRRNLTRDESKHRIEPAHKILLMEELAAAMTREGAAAWDWPRLQRWLTACWRDNQEMRDHYQFVRPPVDIEVVGEDLRDATFIVRGASRDRFRFVHASVHEYFLARYLARGLLAGG
ncbi:MAG: NACHT domain-containing protein, partial [Bifidobacteriaceae bacterium]|nr:NACHT domain-containing protein [Bifidobacteriaceae bacterium]